MRSRLLQLFVLAGLIAGWLVPAAPADVDEIVLVFPQQGEESTFDNTWGNARSGGRSHQGTDILGDQMTPVVAAMDGTVKKFGYGPRSGYYLVLSHADGIETWYMHLNNDVPGTDNGRGAPEYTYAAGLEVGDPVVAGQLLGFVGDSGNAEPTTHHTHFELHINGRPVNPYRYLKAAWERWQLELQIEREEVPFS